MEVYSFFQQNPIPESRWTEVLVYFQEILCLEALPEVGVPQPGDSVSLICSLLEEALKGIKLSASVPCSSAHAPQPVDVEKAGSPASPIGGGQ